MRHPTPFNIKPKQSLGQNFLIDDNIAKKIVRDLHLTEDDVIVEIGPGKGALTKHLVDRVRQLIVVEIDGRVINDLRERFATNNISIIHQDFLDTDLTRLRDEHRGKLRILGNIPYHLTSPILFKVFDEILAVKDLTMMVQREVARRITAHPSTKEYGILSVLTRFYGTPKMLFHVPPDCFYPKPKVTSTVFQVAFFDKLPYTVDALLFKEIVKTTFGKRRKTLGKSLHYLPRDPSIIERITKGNEAGLKRRPEELSVADFVSLTQDIEKIIACQKK